MIEFDPLLKEQVIFQNESRRSWKGHDTEENLNRFIVEEYAELEQAVEMAMIGESAFAVASEMGDVFYLYIKRLEAFPNPVPEHIMEIVERTAELADLGGFNPEDCVRMKILRNDMKYIQAISNGGLSYEEGRRLSKQQWEIMGGDHAFSIMFEALATEFNP